MNKMQRIRLGLLCANIKLGKMTMDAYTGKSDPNPENWRTISGAKVHLTNGRIDGGAGGKFEGQEWKGKTKHGSEREKRISSRVQKMDVPLGVKQDILKAFEDFRDDNSAPLTDIEDINNAINKKIKELSEKRRQRAAYADPKQQLRADKKHQKEIKEIESDIERLKGQRARIDQQITSNNLEDYIEAAASRFGDDLTDKERKELNDFLTELKQGDFEHKPKGGRMESLFSQANSNTESNNISGEQEGKKKLASNSTKKKEIPRPKNEQPGLRRFKMYDVKAKNDAERLSQVNPHFTSGGIEYKTNCQRCVIAYELQKRGYDVEAKPCDENDPLDSHVLDAWDFDPSTWAFDDGFAYVNHKSKFKAIAKKSFDKWGDGSRAVVKVKWNVKNANKNHVFFAENQGGKIVYVDPQSGKTRDIDKTLASCTDEPWGLYIMRVDNRKLSNVGIEYGAKNREGET